MPTPWPQFGQGHSSLWLQTAWWPRLFSDVTKNHASHSFSGIDSLEKRQIHLAAASFLCGRKVGLNCQSLRFCEEKTGQPMDVVPTMYENPTNLRYQLTIIKVVTRSP